MIKCEMNINKSKYVMFKPRNWVGFDVRRNCIFNKSVIVDFHYSDCSPSISNDTFCALSNSSF